MRHITQFFRSASGTTRAVGDSAVQRTAIIEMLESRSLLSVAVPIVSEVVLPGQPATLATLQPAAVSAGVLSASLSGVPTFALPNTVNKSQISVKLTNSGLQRARGPVTITFFVSTDQNLDSSDDRGTSVTKNVNIPAGKSKTIKVKLGTIPSVDNGTYWLLAQISGAAAGPTTTAVSPNTIRINTPFIDLTGQFTSVPSIVRIGKRATLKLDVINNGTSQANGRLTIELARSTSADGSNADSLTEVIRTIRLAPGGRYHLTLSGRTPGSPGTFYMVALIDPSNDFHDGSLANNTVVSPSPVTFV